MRTLVQALTLLLLASLIGPSSADSTIRLLPSRTTVTPLRVRPVASTPKTGPGKMDRPGPVRSPDPYFTLRIGENEVYRDAKDPTQAYYRPILRLGKRAGTPLAEGVGDLAAGLDGFRFRYYKFESGGSPKWGDMQVVVVAERPADVTLEVVQKSWADVTRLDPLPLRLDVSTGVRMILPYPPRAVGFSQLDASGGDGDAKWYYFSTNTHPTPADLLTDSDNSTLNESKVKDFSSLITSDLSDMPSFQPVLEVKAVYPGWAGFSPLMRSIVRLVPMVSLQSLSGDSAAAKGSTGRAPAGRPRIRIMRLSGQPVEPEETMLPQTTRPLAAFRIPPAAASGRPGVTDRPVAIRRPMLLRPDLIRVIGTLRPREDIDYTYSASQQLVAQIPISYPKAKTQNYDYYFLSDSGRFGGPYFEPSPLPNRPQRAEAPEGFAGYWYESHSFGKRLVWPAPKGLRLRWEVESGLRPSCRFSLTSKEGGKLTAHVSYDLYPEFSMRQLDGIVADLGKQTGEKVDLLPFTDLLDANQVALSSGNQTVKDLVAAKQVSVTKLSPKMADDAWFRVAVEMPIDDWATFTLFMKTGELGAWDFGLLTGAGSGMAEKAAFQLEGDLLQTLGGPVVAQKKSYDAATGGYEVAFDNYGLAPVAVKGMRFVLTGAEQSTADVWFDGKEIDLPGVGSASSFDQKDGSGGSIAAAAKVDSAADLKALMDTGKYKDMAVQLTSDMIGPSTAPEAAGGADPDILFSFLRSLCYQYIGSSEIIQVPVVPAELSQWSDYRSGSITLRFQGFVYTKQLELSGTNKVDVRRLPREGAYAAAGKPGDADLLEYRAVFVKKDGTVVNLPGQPVDESKWLTGDITGVNLDMTQAQ